MKMPIIESYLDDLIKNSTLDVPAWNIEAARKVESLAGTTLMDA